MARPRRARAPVNYSQFGDVEEAGRKRSKDASDSDEFVIDHANEEDEEDEEEEFEYDAQGIKMDDDEDEQAAVSEEDENGEDIIDFNESAEKPVKKKKGKLRALDIAPLSSSAGVPLLRTINSLTSDTKANTSRKSDTLRQRLELFHGKNTQDLVAAIQERNKWDTCAYIPPRSKLEYPSEYEAAIDSAVPLDASQNITVSGADQLLVHSICVSPYLKAPFVTLDPGATVGLPSEGCLLNVGGLVSCCKWAPGRDDSQTQYLAVSIIPFTSSDLSSANDESEFASRYDLALFNTNTNGIPGIVRIYEYHEGKNAACSLIGDYRFPNCGPATHVEWRPCSTSDVIGTLGVRFQNGHVQVIDVGLYDSNGSDTASTTLHVGIPKYDLSLPSIISSFTWRTPNHIAVACTDGFIGEFYLGSSNEKRQIPLYYYPAHSSAITAISSAWPRYPYLLFTSSADGFLRQIDVRDLKRSREFSARNKTYSLIGSYTRFMNSYIVSEEFTITKMCAIRGFSSQSGASSLTKHDGSVTASATSLLHPIYMSGGADGTVRVGNVIRRVGGRKIKQGAPTEYNSATLWRFEYSEKHNQFRFTDLAEPIAMSNQEMTLQQHIFPKAAVVSSVDWVPSKSSGSLYCAGLVCGLIRIEDIANL